VKILFSGLLNNKYILKLKLYLKTLVVVMGESGKSNYGGAYAGHDWIILWMNENSGLCTCNWLVCAVTPKFADS
jgi:hypothetical protein